MSTLFCELPYNLEQINSLPHIAEAKEIELQHSAGLIGQVLAKHNVERLFAVTRLHNHYQLNKGERVVISSHPCEGANATPRGFEKNPVNVLVKQAVRCTSDEVVPVNFLMQSDGSLFGTEYIRAEVAESLGLARLLDGLIGNKALMEDLVAAMTTNHLCDELGLQ